MEGQAYSISGAYTSHHHILGGGAADHESMEIERSTWELL